MMGLQSRRYSSSKGKGKGFASKGDGRRYRTLVKYLLVVVIGICLLIKSGHPAIETVLQNQGKYLDWISSFTNFGSSRRCYVNIPISTNNINNSSSNSTYADTVGECLAWEPPTAKERCDFVMERFAERDVGLADEDLSIRYQVQSEDPNIFYRATAHVFWNDFVLGPWGDSLELTLDEKDTTKLKEEGLGSDGLDPQATWTWVTGDQHLSNFGAWRNRGGKVVFGVNDFDEAAIFDFQIDVMRIAVSVLNHALTNGLDTKQAEQVLLAFADTYVQTVLDYIGNERALLFELTKETTTGKLKEFLEEVENGKSMANQMKKFTEQDEETGVRRFQKGPVGKPHPKTSLTAVDPKREAEIREAFSATQYGATMMKLGWAVRKWDDDFFTVLDVAERRGSGVGSFGVARYYVLLKGTDGLLGEDGVDGTAVVLDVKYQPSGAVAPVLTPEETAWYDVMFPNAAARTVEAQRRLTSYTDPFTGWVVLEDDEDGVSRSFAVRQRSPWQDDFDLSSLTDPDDYVEYMSQIAQATATSHVRGTVATRPGDFKTIINILLGEQDKRDAWAQIVTHLAFSYHDQVLLDYQCFQDHVFTYHQKTGNSHHAGKGTSNLASKYWDLFSVAFQFHRWVIFGSLFERTTSLSRKG